MGSFLLGCLRRARAEVLGLRQELRILRRGPLFSGLRASPETPYMGSFLLGYVSRARAGVSDRRIDPRRSAPSEFPRMIASGIPRAFTISHSYSVLQHVVFAPPR